MAGPCWPAIRQLMDQFQISFEDRCRHMGTIIHVAVDGEYAGHIVISDQPKPEAAQALSDLKAAGVRRTVMLTGDAQSAAEGVARELGLDEFHAELLPGDKVDQVERLLAQKQPKENLAFVGDGINDAPVLSRADIGVAMGALGSDAAIEAADIVLMDDEPLQAGPGGAHRPQDPVHRPSEHRLRPGGEGAGAGPVRSGLCAACGGPSSPTWASRSWPSSTPAGCCGQNDKGPF